MTELGGAFETTERGNELGPREEVTVWLVSTLVFCLLPFLILPFAYHALQTPHRWPSIFILFGHGDIGLVIIAVLGATLAELTISPSSLSLSWRAILVAASVVDGLLAISIYAISAYQVLASKEPDIEVNTYVLLSLLGFSVAIHIIAILNRKKEAN